MLGHSSVAVTERYAHLRVDLYAESALSKLTVDLTPPAGKVLPMQEPGAVSYTGVTRTDEEGDRS